MGGRAVAGTSSRKSTSRSKSEPDDGIVLLTKPAGERIGRELAALALLAITAFTTLSLVSAEILRWPNLCGPLGRTISDNLDGYFGYGAFILPMLAIGAALAIWSAAGWRALARIGAGGLMLLVSAVALGAMIGGVAAGGYGGAALAGLLSIYMGSVGGYLVVVLGLICGFALLLRRAPTELMTALKDSAAGALRRRPASEPDRDSGAFELGPESLADGSQPLMLTIRQEESGPERRGFGLLSILARPKAERAAETRPMTSGDYQLPPLSFGHAAFGTYQDRRRGAQAQRQPARAEARRFRSRGQGRGSATRTGGDDVQVRTGFGRQGEPDRQPCSDDLSMALKALAIRIQAPVPGEAVVGIEVPNRQREKVYLREILESEEFAAAQSHLTIALGKDIAGKPVVADLARMPHLLIAGATGTGKSVSIHTMIASVLFNATADDVRFILINPKMLELSVYDNIPHLLVPVVVEPDKAAAALLWATQEMENRYRPDARHGSA